MEIQPRQAVIPLAYGKRIVKIELTTREECRQLIAEIARTSETLPDDGHGTLTLMALAPRGEHPYPGLVAPEEKPLPRREPGRWSRLRCGCTVPGGGTPGIAAWCSRHGDTAVTETGPDRFTPQEDEPDQCPARAFGRQCELLARHPMPHGYVNVNGDAVEWTGSCPDEDCALDEQHDGDHEYPVLCQRHGGTFGPADCDYCADERTPADPSGDGGELPAPVTGADVLLAAAALDIEMREAASGMQDPAPVVRVIEPAERCGSRPYPAGSEGDDGTECVLPKGHDGDHDDGVVITAPADPGWRDERTGLMSGPAYKHLNRLSCGCTFAGPLTWPAGRKARCDTHGAVATVGDEAGAAR